jgi:hypothetical protein
MYSPTTIAAATCTRIIYQMLHLAGRAIVCTNSDSVCLSMHVNGTCSLIECAAFRLSSTLCSTTTCSTAFVQSGTTGHESPAAPKRLGMNMKLGTQKSGLQKS